jgi:hypothetical protein
MTSFSTIIGKNSCLTSVSTIHAFENFDLQKIFQLANLLTVRTGRHIQAFGGESKTLITPGRFKYAQRFKRRDRIFI